MPASSPRLAISSLLLTILPSLLAITPLPAATQPPSAIQVRLDATDGGALRAGTPLRIEVNARDPATGYPLTAMTPALWLVPDDGEQQDGRCERLVNRLAASAVPPEGTIDANGFDLIQATDDGRLALVDPLLNLASANIKAILDLGGLPAGWALDSTGAVLAAALRRERVLVLIDMNRFAIMHREVVGAEPSAVVAAGKRFWAGSTDGSVIALDGAGHRQPPIRIGDGPVSLAAAGGTVVALARSGEGAFLGATDEPSRFALGVEADAVVYAPIADAAYALSAGGEALFFVPQDSPQTVHRIALERPARSLTASPDGRRLALVAADGGAVTLFDVESGRARWTIKVNDPVVAVGFSDAFLYLAHKRVGGATRVVFDPAGGRPGTVMIAAGSRGEEDNAIATLPIMTNVPRAGILIASRRDRTAYMIDDGSAQAAMSSLPLRAGRPAGILLRYRGLQALGNSGKFVVETIAPRAGRYLAVVRTDRPAIAHCASATIQSSPGEVVRTSAVHAAPEVRVLSTLASLPAGTQSLRFSVSGTPVALLGVMLIGDGWQTTPTDLRVAGGGYEMPVDLAPGKDFTLFVRYRDGATEMILSTPVEVRR